MSLLTILLYGGLACIVLPVLAYMVVKFGASGYFRAKRRDEQNQKNEREKQ